MQIAATYSHLNGMEYLLVHRSTLWSEILDVIASVDAATCKTKVSKEKTMRGKLLYSPVDMNDAFKISFRNQGWTERRNTFWVTDDEELMRSLYNQPAAEQKMAIRAAGREPIMFSDWNGGD